MLFLEIITAGLIFFLAKGFRFGVWCLPAEASAQAGAPFLQR
jgi:hypothetical protein